MSGIPNPPIVLIDESKDLNNKFYLILNEIVKTYPSAKLNPALKSKYDITQTNSVLYEENMQKLVNLQNEYFLYKNKVVSASETILQSITETDTQINILENKNKVLSVQLENLKNSSYSAEGLFDDTQITRNQLLISNIIFFSVICGGGFMYFKSLKAGGT